MGIFQIGDEKNTHLIAWYWSVKQDAMTVKITYIIYLICVFYVFHCNMIDWRINYEAINTVTVQEVYENDSYEISGKKSQYYIEGSTDMGINVKHFL